MSFTVTPELLELIDPELAGGLGGLLPRRDLARGGSILSGFAAGMQGKENPVAAQMNQQIQQLALIQARRAQLAQRQQEATSLQGYREATLGQGEARLQLGKEQLAETARGHTLTAETARAAQQIRSVELKTNWAWKQIDTGLPNQVRDGYERLNALGWGFTPEEIEKATKDTAFSKAMKDRSAFVAASVLEGVDPGVPVPPEFAELARINPEAFSVAHKIPGPAARSAAIKTALVEAAKHQLLLDLQGKIPTPAQLFFLQGKVGGYDQLRGLAHAMVAEGTPLPPYLQSIYDQDVRVQKLDERAKTARVNRDELRRKIDQLILEAKKDPTTGMGKIQVQMKRHQDMIIAYQMDIELSPDEIRSAVEFHRGALSLLKRAYLSLSRTLPGQEAETPGETFWKRHKIPGTP